MDAHQLGSYTLPADNKGILSLLTAIEQSEDNDQPPVETSPSKLEEKEGLSVSADNFSNLNLESLEMSGDINLANLSLCLICGRNFNLESSNSGMIDINTLIDIPGDESRSIQSVVEEFIPLGHEESQGESSENEESGYICVECFLLLDGILKLRAQIHEYVTTLKSKHTDWIHTRRKCSKDLLELRLPISILNVRGDGILNVREESEDVSTATNSPLAVLETRVEVGVVPATKKSKLQILAETLEEERQHSSSSVVDPSPSATADDFRLTPDVDEPSSGSGGALSVTTTSKRGGNSKSSVLSVTKSIDPAQLHQTGKPSTVDKENSCDRCRSVGNRNKKAKLNCDNCAAYKDKLVSCSECDNTFSTKVKLKEHVAIFHSSKIQSRYSCRSCDQVFVSKQSRTKHENTRHRRLQQEGPTTGSSGSRSNNCGGRMQQQQNHACEECGEQFQSYQTLQWHRSRHTGDFAFSCQHCGKGFNNFKLLEEHEHIHTGRKPYACGQCSKSFANRGSLWLHVKKHETEKPYACDYCTKSFGHPSHLAVHKRMHTGEKPYVCRLCDEKFISGNYLKRHMKTHKNQDPFACGLCNKTFQKRSELSKHGNEEHGGKVVDALPPQQHFDKDDPLQLSTVGGVELGAAISQTANISQGSAFVDKQVVVDPRDVVAAGSRSAVAHTTTTTSSSSTTSKTKEYLLVDQADRLLSLPKLTSEDSDFLLPVNILEEDNKEPIVFIQVTENQQFQSGFMQ